MRKGIVVDVTTADRARLEAVVANRNSLQKHVWRASIILLTAAGLGTNAIKRGTGRSKSVVWRWQERFMQEGVDGLLRDKTRPPGRKPLDGGSVLREIGRPALVHPDAVPESCEGMGRRITLIQFNRFPEHFVGLVEILRGKSIDQVKPTQRVIVCTKTFGPLSSHAPDFCAVDVRRYGLNDPLGQTVLHPEEV